ncbi:hypothetical protein RRG08_023007 [Elysia crispata]|uniref:Uncharacterized protein n=1 Tax=Elysia crispata TaxID=231223 RepID=A0AAE1AG00_9GAST|nr:hypothetical protein RRG08_023007 [Elysia crispata]
MVVQTNWQLGISARQIQRGWRSYLRNKKVQSSNTTLKPSTSPFLSTPSSSPAPTITTTITIDDAVTPSPPPAGDTTTTVKNSTHQISGIDTKTATIDTAVKPEKGGIDTLASSAITSAGQSPQDDYQDSNPPTELSDHDDENSETESAIAGCAMTLLSPEENQGGGEHTPATSQPTHNDDDTEEEEEVAEEDNLEAHQSEHHQHHHYHHHQHQPHQPSSTSTRSAASPEAAGSIPSSDPEDISPVLPQIAAQVPAIQPVLDSQEILSPLKIEEDLEAAARAARDSPSRSSLGPGANSADADARSVASSDYSELGGPLRDLERDVAALDGDSHRAVSGLADSSYLDDLYRSFDGSRGGGEGFFGGGGGLGRLGAGALTVRVAEEEGPLEKKEDESEEEFGRRVRKVNLLSLAQEFAELKKLDAQACPIDHARNSKRSGSLARAGSDSPRGVSLERAGAGCGRRTQSRSPGRFAGQQGRRGANLRAAGAGGTYRAESKSPGRPGDMSDATAAAASKTGNLPRNHEKILEGCASSSTSELDETDLPVNEARRRGSSADLPANMRPGRQQQQKAGGGAGEEAEADGDFDVYNMESAVPDMSWEMVERHIQERIRREVRPLVGCV